MRVKGFILLVISIVIISVLIQYPMFNDEYLSYIMIIPGLLLGFILTVIVHETGHLVFGLLSGYKFTSFKVLFVKIYKKDKIRFSFERGFLTMPGQCLMKPTNRKYFLYNIGGLIFTYCFSFVLLYLFYFVDNGFTVQFLFGVLFVNTLLGVMNSIYNKEGINDVCNIVRCYKDKEYLEALLYQLDIYSNIAIENKFKSKYKPKEEVGNLITDISLCRIRYLKAYHEKNQVKLSDCYLYMKRKYSNIPIPILKIPILVMLLNHEFMVMKNISLVERRLKRIRKKELESIKKFKDEYKVIQFYQDIIINKIEVSNDIFESMFIDNPVDLFERISNKWVSSIKRVYEAYVREGFELK